MYQEIFRKLKRTPLYNCVFIGLMALKYGYAEHCKPSTSLRWMNVIVRGIPSIYSNCRILVPKISQCAGHCHSEDEMDLNSLQMKSICHCCMAKEMVRETTYPYCLSKKSGKYGFVRRIKDYSYVKVKSCTCMRDCQKIVITEFNGSISWNSTVKVNTIDLSTDTFSFFPIVFALVSSAVFLALLFTLIVLIYGSHTSGVRSNIPSRNSQTIPLCSNIKSIEP